MSGDDRERDLDRELDFHHRETMAELEARGLSADEAAREAARRFGDRNRWRLRILAAGARGSRRARARSALTTSASALGRDVAQAGRSLSRSRGFTAAAASVFALGLAAVACALTLLHGVVLAPLPYPDAVRLVYVWGRNHNVRAGYLNLTISEPDLHDWRAGTQHALALGGVIPDARTLTGVGDAERITAVAVIGDLFDALAVPPLFGRTLRAGDTPDGRPPVVLGHGLWSRKFSSDPAVIGRTLTLDDRPHEIVGVMPAEFAFPRVEEISANYGFGAGVELYVPWRPGDAGPPRRGNRYVVAVARLRDASTTVDLERELTAISDRAAGRPPLSGDQFAAVPMHEQATSGVRQTIWLVLAAAGAVLAIACLNVAHLLLARLHGRHHEFAVRASLGAGRFALVRQVVFEALLLAALGGAAGTGAAALIVAALRGLAPADLPRAENIALNSAVLLPLLGVIAASGVGVGIIAAATLRSRTLRAALRETGRGASRGSGLSRTIVGAEVALSVLLLLGCGLLVRSLWLVASTPPGFAVENVVTLQMTLTPARFPTGADLRRGFDQILAAVRGVGGVSHAALTWQLPMSGVQGSTSYAPEDGPGGMALIHRVSPGYFDTMGLRILRGRGLQTESDLPPLVINDTLARTQWRDREPLGAIVTVNGVRSRIIGVVSDVRHGSLEQPPAPEMYRDARLRTMFLVARTSVPPSATLPQIRAAIAALDPSIALSDIKTMEQRLAGTTARRRFIVTGMSLFAAVATTLAAVGLYGVTAMLVVRRRREVGIRLALGATPRGAVSLLTRQLGVVVLGGIGLGTAVAALLAPQLEPMLHETSATDPATYAITIATLLATAALAVYVPTRRASSVDPASVLRGN